MPTASQNLIRARKPLIEAFQFDGTSTCYDDILVWLTSCGEAYVSTGDHIYRDPILVFRNTDGTFTGVKAGEWIVRDSENVFRVLSDADLKREWEIYA